MSTRPFRRALGEPKTGLDREKFNFPADFGSVREGFGTCLGHLKAMTGRSGRARAELSSSIDKLGLPTCVAASPTIRQRDFTNYRDSVCAWQLGDPGNRGQRDRSRLVLHRLSRLRILRANWQAGGECHGDTSLQPDREPNLVWCLSITATAFLGRSDARCQGEPSPSMSPR